MAREIWNRRRRHGGVFFSALTMLLNMFQSVRVQYSLGCELPPCGDPSRAGQLIQEEGVCRSPNGSVREPAALAAVNPNPPLAAVRCIELCPVAADQLTSVQEKR